MSWKNRRFGQMKEQEEILRKIKEYVQSIEPESEIILFGSRARGEEREDWDTIYQITPLYQNIEREGMLI